MGLLRVGVISARGVADVDWGLAGKSDPYMVVVVGKEYKQTKTIRESLDPVWNETFEFSVADPSEEVVTFILWDEDTSRRDTIIAVAALPLNSLVKGQERQLELPLLRYGSEGCKSGFVTVTVLAADFSGLKAEVSRLQQAESRLKLEVEQLSEAKRSLEAAEQELADSKRSLEAEVQGLAEAKRGLEDEEKELEEAKRSLEAEVQQLASACSGREAEGQQLAQDKSCLEAEVVELRGNLATAEEVAHRMRAVEADLRAEVEKLRQELEARSVEPVAAPAAAQAEVAAPVPAAPGALSPQEEEGLKALWEDCNMDGDSERVTRAELQATVIKKPEHQALLGLAIRPDASGRRHNQRHTVEAFYKLLDSDSSGGVTWDELKTAFSLHIIRMAKA